MNNALETPLSKSAPRRYSNLSKTKTKGATYTPAALAGFVADRMLETRMPQRGPLRVLDPAAGDGALLEAFLERLPQDSLDRTSVTAFDTDSEAADVLESRIRSRFPTVHLTVERDDFLTYALNQKRGGLLPCIQASFDYVISNPPYVRTQILGAHAARALAASFGLTGRIDLFQPFLLAIAGVLATGGVAGVIVSNRVMTTKGCSTLRRELLSRFKVIHAWDLGDSKLFDAAVLPAVLLATTPGTGEAAAMTSIYETTEAVNAGVRESPLDALLLPDGSVVEVHGTRTARRFLVRAGTMDNGGDPEGVWRPATPSSDEWMRKVNDRTWGKFGSIGKIRVGIKTTADKVFIRNDWEEIPTGEPELLRPLTTRGSARRFKQCIPDRPFRVLYTHEALPNGKRRAIDLAMFPRDAAYLESHRLTLQARKYVIEAGRNWYEIWVPQHPAAWTAPKLVFPDISEKPIFWIDQSGSVINGDCYWFSLNENENPDLLWIALAVGNSDFVEKFYDHRFNNKLYAGRRRFITQYVEEFPLPNPDLSLSRQIAALARRVHELTPSREADELAAALNEMVWQSFGLGEEISR